VDGERGDRESLRILLCYLCVLYSEMNLIVVDIVDKESEEFLTIFRQMLA